MAIFGLFWAVFRTIVLKVRDGRPESSRRSPLRQAAISDEGCCSFMSIGLSKDGKWVFNKACTTPWCHAVVHFEVKMRRFLAVFQDNRRNHGGTLKQAVFLQQ